MKTSIDDITTSIQKLSLFNRDSHIWAHSYIEMDAEIKLCDMKLRTVQINLHAKNKTIWKTILDSKSLNETFFAFCIREAIIQHNQIVPFVQTHPLLTTAIIPDQSVQNYFDKGTDIPSIHKIIKKINIVNENAMLMDGLNESSLLKTLNVPEIIKDQIVSFPILKDITCFEIHFNTSSMLKNLVKLQNKPFKAYLSMPTDRQNDLCEE